MRQILWWAWLNLARARIEPEIVPDPHFVVPKLRNIEVLIPKNKNDLGTMQGWIGHYFGH